MRPIRLELEGFTAYREYTVVDFEGADLFVLTGPTGSGKSSLIDALTFALYGSVARYQNPNLVHPVVSQGKVEAKVRFDFALGAREYSAVRVVRKTPRGGATTKEARLESGGVLIAGTADEMTRMMREMLGLNFEQFTTCVVLPQGDFARFLHDKPAQRQDLLTKLLGVDVYEKMGNLARTREAVAKQRVQLHEEELERIRDATASATKAAEKRVRELAQVKDTIEKNEPELERLDKTIETKRREAIRFDEAGTALGELSIPRGVAELAEKIDGARREQAERREARTRAEETLQTAETTHAALPDASELNESLRVHALREKRRGDLDGAKTAAVDARTAFDAAKSIRDEAEAGVAEARAAFEATQRELAAHALAQHLENGQPCPVCQQMVETVPKRSLPPALRTAEKNVAAAESARARSEKTFRTAEKQLTLDEERLRTIQEELDGLNAKLENTAERAAIEAELAKIQESALALEDARQRARVARAAEQTVHERLDALSAEETRAWKRFDDARDTVAGFAPPTIERDALGGAWTRLTSWARAQSRDQKEAANEARQEARDAEEARNEIVASIEEQAGECGVELSRERPRDAIVSALAEAEQEAKRIRDAVKRARALRKKLDAERENAAVAGALGQHLRSTGFERWLLDEAFRRLVEGATAILNELSSGQYSFEYDDKLNFEVVDHRNADERRSARTLSGGETFLASLALALTLAEQTAELAADGSAKLESLFLDEGFGTLDNDTLEVVASAIEDLGAKGRVVGLVTHQQSLADKIGVQFRVDKGPVTATVEKVVA